MRDFKQEYIAMRNSKVYNIQFFYDYYIDKGGQMVDPNEFTETFMFTHMEQPTPAGYPPIRMRTGERDREEILNYMDVVFELTVLKDKEGNVIKVIE